MERALDIVAAEAGRRLDQVLAQRLPDFSRGRIQGWIDAGMVRLDGRPAKRSAKLVGGERVRIEAWLPQPDTHAPEPMDLAILFEDRHLLVIDKPAGLVVHPAAGNWQGTLLNGLLHHAPDLAGLPRCGIVHRLDKDTSGLLVVAKTPGAHKSLVAQLQARTVTREYRALVVGRPAAGGSVDAPIGRHPVRRTAMAVTIAGKPAVTDYRVLARWPGHTLLALRLRTGRTHQIRVHMAHIGHPLVGDPLYGGRVAGAGLPAAAARAVRDFPRQALHALRLGLVHPQSGESMAWEAPLAADFQGLLAALEPLREAQPADV
ncbi:23S rRNA pseudouridine(1911/1915/1917) synthase RluD [uncultured Thiohalocapsa sp.]|uniref:23S rRNA pseudouridine(1911/1915/1917) synthase RluD n=1 Tax=uncultured Thiohalocapsa sp. TaxID=768990 RepID=UPI0025FF0D63|nr:23S rRNA pseudouridine(1911/1915/1917) synthase RluD [uncultured Thiohalocapsa sp.]